MALSEAQLAQRRAASKAGGKARGRQLKGNRAYMAALSAKVSREARQRAGRKGWEALVNKLGLEAAYDVAAQWRLDHPTSAELDMARMLYEIGLTYGKDYHREGKIDGLPQWRVDFRNGADRDSPPPLVWWIEVRGGVHDLWGDAQQELDRWNLIQSRGGDGLQIDARALKPTEWQETKAYVTAFLLAAEQHAVQRRREEEAAVPF